MRRQQHIHWTISKPVISHSYWVSRDHWLLWFSFGEDGQLFTWGQNTNGQLGLGKGESSKLFPQPLKSLAGIPLAKITAGGDHSFALSLSGAVFGWGKNKAGQLGLNDKQGMDN